MPTAKTINESNEPGAKAFASSGVVISRDRAYDYIRFHTQAFLCPAPESDIAELLQKHHAMDAGETSELLAGMVAAGDIFYSDQRVLSTGYVATVDK